ncbi:MAG: hypothetical protein K2Q20_08565, partial [Phycisphaerales bacterium]|nr:hypothetical protein [Phycisphaerales bacterium]
DLVSVDNSNGSYPPPPANAAGLSYGSLEFRNPPATPALQGQNGELAAGVYYLALVAGDAASVSAGPTGFAVTTTSTISFLLDPAQPICYATIDIFAGNTTPVPAPSNDNCAGALPVTENATGPGGVSVPAFSGNTAGASNDGFSPCNRQATSPANLARDVWFSYVPAQTGKVVVTAKSEDGDIVLSQFEGECFSGVRQCSGGAILDFGEGTRLLVDTVAGQPILFSASHIAGYVGSLELNIRQVPPPCTLAIPAGAVPESELGCGDATNNGCSDDATVQDLDQLLPNQTRSGTLYAGRQLRDIDWYSFTIDQPSRVSVTFASTYSARVAIIKSPGAPVAACFGETMLYEDSPDFFSPCAPSTTAVVDLQPGTYSLAFLNGFFDGIECGAGYEPYYFRLNVESAAGPCCRGTTCLTVASTACATPTGGLAGRPMTSCSSPISSGGCCKADFDGNGTRAVTDLFTYLSAWFARSPYAAVNGDGLRQPVVTDIFGFLSLWFAGC